jgi:hypothetical protein
MKTPEELYAEVLAAITRVQAANQEVLEAQARLAQAQGEKTAADAELIATRAAADEAIDIAIGKRPTPA